MDRNAIGPTGRWVRHEILRLRACLSAVAPLRMTRKTCPFKQEEIDIGAPSEMTTQLTRNCF